MITDELPVGTYTFSLDNTINGGCNLKANDNSGTTLASMYFSTEGRKTITFTLSQSTKIFINGFSNTSGTTFVDGTDNFQLEKGSQATPYLPYNTLEVKVQNKNLVDVSKMQFGTISQTDGTTISSSGDVKYSDYINVKPNETYALSFGGGTPTIRIFKYDKNKNYLGTSAGTSSTIAIDSNTYYIRLQGNKSFIDNNFQLELGSTVTSYIAHAETLYQLSLGEYEFAKIGNYVDTIEYDVDEDKVYKNEKIEKRLAVITGGNLESHGFRASTDGTEVAPISAYPELLCNFFKRASDYSQSVNADWLNPNKLGINAVGGILCNISNFSTLDEYTGFFSNNDVYICYPKATPTEIPITDQTLINQVKAWYNAQSNNGTTIITSNGNLPLVIKVRALKGE